MKTTLELAKGIAGGVLFDYFKPKELERFRKLAAADALRDAAEWGVCTPEKLRVLADELEKEL